MSYDAPPPPPPGNQPPAGYGMPQPGYGIEQPKNSTLAIVSLVTGILGVTICCGAVVLSIAAIVTGVMANKEIAESGGQKKGAGMAKAGLILGIVGIVIAILYWILVAVGTIHMGFSTSTS